MSRGVGGDGPPALVERFYRAFTDQDLDGFVATLHPEVELQTARGVREGRSEARDWATKRTTGELDQRVLVEEVRVDERAAHAVALVRKQWWWRRSEELALEERVAALFTFRDRLIARWQPFTSRGEALALLDRLEASSTA